MNRREKVRRHVKKHALGYAIGVLFLVSWVGQLFAEAAVFIDEQRVHGEAVASVWSAMAMPDFRETFWQSTLENWQSEWLQVVTFILATAFLVFQGSAESKDTEDRIEEKVNAIMRRLDMSPGDVEAQMGEEYETDG